MSEQKTPQPSHTADKEYLMEILDNAQISSTLRTKVKKNIHAFFERKVYGLRAPDLFGPKVENKEPKPTVHYGFKGGK